MNDRNEDKIEFLWRVSELEKEKIQDLYPGLDDSFFMKDCKDPDKPFKVVLGEGTFSKARLGKIQTENYVDYVAIRKIKAEPTDKSKPPGSPLSRRQVKEMTEKELQIQDKLEQLFIEKNISVEHIALPIKIIRHKNKNQDDQLYQIYPLADMGNGKSFIDMLEKKQIDQKTRILLANCIAVILLKTLSQLHENSIYNNDIKPDNLLLGSAGLIQLSDFGSAICFRDDKIEIEASELSDSRYIHPKVLQDKVQNDVDKRQISKKKKGEYDDGWALALTLLEFYSTETKEIAQFIKMGNSNVKDTPFGSLQIYYESQIENLRRSPSFKEIPVPVQSIILALLELNIDNRNSLCDILKLLPLDNVQTLPSNEIKNIFLDILKQKDVKPSNSAVKNPVEPSYLDDTFFGHGKNSHNIQTPTPAPKFRKRIV